jgi:hypothetical protein
MYASICTCFASMYVNVHVLYLYLLSISLCKVFKLQKCLLPRSYYITWKYLTLNANKFMYTIIPDMWGILSLKLGKSQCYSSTKMMTHDCVCATRSSYTICQPAYHKASTCIAKWIAWYPNKLHMLFSSTPYIYIIPITLPYTFPYTSCSLSKKENPTSQLEKRERKR